MTVRDRLAFIKTKSQHVFKLVSNTSLINNFVSLRIKQASYVSSSETINCYMFLFKLPDSLDTLCIHFEVLVNSTHG